MAIEWFLEDISLCSFTFPYATVVKQRALEATVSPREAVTRSGKPRRVVRFDLHSRWSCFVFDLSKIMIQHFSVLDPFFCSKAGYATGCLQLKTRLDTAHSVLSFFKLLYSFLYLFIFVTWHCFPVSKLECIVFWVFILNTNNRYLRRCFHELDWTLVQKEFVVFLWWSVFTSKLCQGPMLFVIKLFNTGLKSPFFRWSFRDFKLLVKSFFSDD